MAIVRVVALLGLAVVITAAEGHAQAEWPWLLRVNYSNVPQAGTTGKPAVPAGQVLVEAGLMFSYRQPLTRPLPAPAVKLKDATGGTFSMLAVVEPQNSSERDVAEWLKSGAGPKPGAAPPETVARLRTNLFSYFFAVPEGATLPFTLLFEGRSVELWLFDLPSDRGQDGEMHNKRMKLTKPAPKK